MKCTLEEIKKAFDHLLMGFSFVQKLFQQEKEKSKQVENAKKKLLQNCKILHDGILECNLNFPSEDGDKVSLYPSSPVEALSLLKASDDQISLLLKEVPF